MATSDLTLISEATLPDHLAGTLNSAKSYADTKKTEAIADATTKYGGLPDRMLDVETRNTEQDERLTNLEPRIVPTGADVHALDEGVWGANNSVLANSLTNKPELSKSPAIITVTGRIDWPHKIRWDEIPNASVQARSWECNFDGVSWSDWEERARGPIPLKAGFDVRELLPGEYSSDTWDITQTAITRPLDDDAQTPAIIRVSGSFAIKTIIWECVPNRTLVGKTFKLVRDGFGPSSGWSEWQEDPYIAAVEAERWKRGQPASGANVQALDEGVWEASTSVLAASLTNGPTRSARPANITITGRVGSPRKIEWEELPNASIQPKSWTSLSDGVSWSDWEERARGPIPLKAGFDVQALLPGEYSSDTWAITQTAITRPLGPGTSTPAIIRVSGSFAIKTVEWECVPNKAEVGRVFNMVRDGFGPSNGWSEWREEPYVAAVEAERWKRGQPASGANVQALDQGVWEANTSVLAESLTNGPERNARPAVITVTGRVDWPHKIRWEELPNVSIAPKTWECHFDGVSWSGWEDTTQGSGGGTETDPVEIATLASRGSEGEQRGMRRILRSLNPALVAPVWACWAPIGRRLTIPTHEGSGEAMHPSVVRIPGGWNGYEYWMAQTPYPASNDAHEDPDIVCSNDGEIWVVPTGLVNPLDDAPGTPTAHNSDTHLVFDGTRMICTWRRVDRLDSNRNIIYASQSTDGSTWSPKVEIYRGGTETIVSQSLIHMGGDDWRLYLIKSTTGENYLFYMAGTAPTGQVPTGAQWGTRVNCDLGSIDPFRDFWHFEVQLYGDQWLMLIGDGERDTTGVDADMFFAKSTDGVNWEVSPLPLLPRVGVDMTVQYKAGFVPSGTGESLVLDVFYSGNRAIGGRRWGTFRTTARMLPGL